MLALREARATGGVQRWGRPEGSSTTSPGAAPASPDDAPRSASHPAMPSANAAGAPPTGLPAAPRKVTSDCVPSTASSTTRQRARRCRAGGTTSRDEGRGRSGGAGEAGGRRTDRRDEELTRVVTGRTRYRRPAQHRRAGVPVGDRPGNRRRAVPAPGRDGLHDGASLPGAAARGCLAAPGCRGRRRTLAGVMSTDVTASAPASRTYRVRTYGCQMNVHDSERLAGLLEGAGYLPAADGRRRGRRRPQHLRRPGERRQPALRQPRPPAPGQGRPPGHADRRRRVPRAEGPRRDRPAGTVGRRRLRHPQRRVAAGPARARPAQRRGAGGDRRGARGLPVLAAGQARLRLLRLGVDQRRLQQHLHVLHRPVAARHGEGPPPRRHPGRGAGAGRPGRARGDAARPERERLRRRVRRPRRLRRPAARHRRDRGPGAGAVHQPAPAGVHRRRHRGDGRDAGGLPPAAHAAAVRFGRRPAPDAPRVPPGALPRRSSTACAPRCPTPRSPPTSSWGSPARPRRTSSRRSTSSGRRASPARSPSSTPSAPGRRPPRWTASCPRTSSRSATCG